MSNTGLGDSPFFIPTDQEQQKDPLPPPKRLENPDQKERPDLTELQSSKVTELQSSELPKQQSDEGTELQPSEVPKLQTYRLRNYDQFRRVEVRLTTSQKRFLDNLEEDIRETMPEGERGNPYSKRITKNSIIRVMVEIMRQLDIKVDARHFQNEGDLLQALFEALCCKVTELRSQEVTE
jgi:hypothetical protein